MIDIVPVVEADFPVLANIFAVAMRPSLADRVLFKEYDHNVDAEQFILVMVKDLGTRPNARLIKTVQRGTDEVVGYAAATFYNADDGKVAPAESGGLPPYINEVFCNDYFGAMGQKRAQHMTGKDFWNWNILTVLPSRQNMGIGSQLLAWGLANWPIGNNPIYLSAQLEGHKFYQKHGWQDVDEVVMDLGKYMPPFSGYGLHKTVCMVRPPQ